MSKAGNHSCFLKKYVLFFMFIHICLYPALSRDFTLPTKVGIVKAMVFPVVKYGSESWTIKKADRRRIDAFELWVLEEALESPLDCKENKPIHSEGNQP